jgi:hypothetical protein
MIVTNGLVYALDINNPRGYNGPAIQNKWTAITTTTYVATGIALSGSSGIMTIPGVGPKTVYRDSIQNNYTSFSPNSASCCPSLFSWSSSVSVTGSTQYTYGIVYKSDSGYTSNNFMYRYEYNGATFVNEFGIFDAATKVALGGGWYYAMATFTTQASTTLLQGSNFYYYNYSTSTDQCYIARVLLVQGNYVGLHPRYWPDPATTRATGGVFNDLVSLNTPDATSLTYSASGTPSFVAASSNYMNLGNNAYTNFTHNAPWAIQMVVNITAFVNTYPGILVKGASSGAGVLLYYDNAGNLVWKHNNSIFIPMTFSFGTPFVLSISYNGANMYFYKNGVLAYTGGAMVATESSTTLSLGKGDEAGTSTIYSFLKYNTYLSDVDVWQNFNTVRGAVGL